MSTSSEGTQNNPVNPEPTPVIIKIVIEGDPTQGTGGSNVTISSGSAFAITTGDIWEISKSTFTGRITEVQIQDDKFPVLPGNGQPSSVTIHFGPDIQLTFGEEGPLTLVNTVDDFLNIESNQVPFNITELGREGKWLESAAGFSQPPTRVVVMSGQSPVPRGDQPLESPDVVLQVTFTNFPP